MTGRTWLWPDHVIGKREARRLREEHNAIANERADLLAALVEMDTNCENRQDEPFVKYIRDTCRAAILKAEGGAK